MGEPSRRAADMNMRPGGGTWDRAAERKKRNARLAQIIDQRPALAAIGMQSDIHRIAMIEP